MRWEIISVSPYNSYELQHNLSHKVSFTIYPSHLSAGRKMKSVFNATQNDQKRANAA